MKNTNKQLIFPLLLATFILVILLVVKPTIPSLFKQTKVNITSDKTGNTETPKTDIVVKTSEKTLTVISNARFANPDEKSYSVFAYTKDGSAFSFTAPSDWKIESKDIKTYEEMGENFSVRSGEVRVYNGEYEIVISPSNSGRSCIYPGHREFNKPVTYYKFFIPYKLRRYKEIITLAHQTLRRGEILDTDTLKPVVGEGNRIREIICNPSEYQGVDMFYPKINDKKVISQMDDILRSLTIIAIPAPSIY